MAEQEERIDPFEDEDATHPDPDEAPEPGDDDVADNPEPSDGEVDDGQQQALETMSQAAERIQRSSYALEQAVNRFNNHPTEQNRAAMDKAQDRVEQATGEIDRLLESDDLDIETAKHLKTLARQIKSDKQGQSEREEKVEQFLNELAERQARAEARSEAFMAQLRFEANHPEIKDQYEAIRDKAWESLQEKARKRNLTQEGMRALWPDEWDAHVKAALEKAKAKQPAGGGEKKPKATKTVKPGASEARGSGAGAPERDPASVLFPDFN